jgi:hypothetical protein
MIDAKVRKDDDKIVITTDRYVSHVKVKGPWKSSFSLTRSEARALRKLLEEME